MSGCQQFFTWACVRSWRIGFISCHALLWAQECLSPWYSGIPKTMVNPSSKGGNWSVSGKDMKAPVCSSREKTGCICLVMFQNIVLQGNTSAQARNVIIHGSLQKQFCKVCIAWDDWQYVCVCRISFCQEGVIVPSLEIKWFCLGRETSRGDRIGRVEESEEL